jgi:glutamyl-tRNA(Gln) amidotransferase subunit E
MDIDYKKIGFKCGIEIHQQLDTAKLFCSCPSVMREDKPDLVVERSMRAVAGELGVVDPAALHEFFRNRRLLYEAYSDTTCLVELDEEPPHPLNQDALKVAIEVAVLLKARLVDELQVMRKTVIDGSNTAGFQRTILLAMDGVLETSEGVIGIPTICLEEDAGRKIAENGNVITYRLDRLGIPLVEIATTPDIKNPRHAREVAEALGMLLRATGKVKRGLGTIRQDINVSIAEGNRIEVKGVQELNAIPKLIENEVKRQLGLIDIKKELMSRSKTDTDIFYEHAVSSSSEEGNPKLPLVDVTQEFKEDNRGWIIKRIESGDKIFAMRIPLFAGLLGKEIMPDYRFGTELSQIAKSATGIGGILHSDEASNKDISERLSNKLNCEPQDAWIAIVGAQGAQETIRAAFGNIWKRCVGAFEGVPEETRVAVGELNYYMRPLPGSARMYPETDEPLIIPDAGMIKDVKAHLPELFAEKASRYEAFGLSGEFASQMSKSALAGKFEAYVALHKQLKPSLIATVLLMAPKEAKKRFNAPVDVLQDRHFEELLSLLEKGVIVKEATVELIGAAAENPFKSILDLASEKKLKMMAPAELESLVDEAIRKNKDIAAGKNAIGVLLGKVMELCKGRADAQAVRQILSKKLA